MYVACRRESRLSDLLKDSNALLSPVSDDATDTKIWLLARSSPNSESTRDLNAPSALLSSYITLALRSSDVTQKKRRDGLNESSFAWALILSTLYLSAPQAPSVNFCKSDFFHEQSCCKTEIEAFKLAAACPEIALSETETSPEITIEAKGLLPTYGSLVSPGRSFTIRSQPPPPPPLPVVTSRSRVKCPPRALSNRIRLFFFASPAELASFELGGSLSAAARVSFGSALLPPEEPLPKPISLPRSPATKPASMPRVVPSQPSCRPPSSSSAETPPLPAVISISAFFLKPNRCLSDGFEAVIGALFGPLSGFRYWWGEVDK